MISDKQKAILAFPYSRYDAIIADGAIRSGKTSFMTVSFVRDAMERFNNQEFIILGNSVESVNRNVIQPYKNLGYARKRYKIDWNQGRHILTVKNDTAENRFYVFGANNERSYEPIQGMTAAGCMVDEVAICNKKAVETATARCSVDGSKLWFNCNPAYPTHWFREEWILDAQAKNALYLHFTMGDNPSLSERIKKRYETMYSGVFYDRYIRGLWVAAEGLIYPMFNDALENTYREKDEFVDYRLSIDYGVKNPFVCLKWMKDREGVWYVVDEYYYSGRDEMHQKTNPDYVNDLVNFVDDYKGDSIKVYVDPSATSFITELRRCTKRRFKVIPAVNDVLPGIEMTAVCLQKTQGLVKVYDSCKHTIREFSSYVWDDKADRDKPVKENDHCLTGDTLIDTDAGQIPIKELVGKTGLVWSIENNKPVLKPFNNVRMTREYAEVFEIETEDGRKIKCTEDHLILTERGWVECRYLLPCDKIVSI